MNEQKKKYLRSNFNKTTIKSIDRMILTNLKKQAKLQAKFMIEINENFKNFLIKEYDLDYSNFKCCETFLNDCNLIDNVDLNSSSVNFIRKEDFFIKLTIPKQINYKQSNETKQMITNTRLSIKFFKSNKKTLNQNQLNFLRSYNSNILTN